MVLACTAPSAAQTCQHGLTLNPNGVPGSTRTACIHTWRDGACSYRRRAMLTALVLPFLARSSSVAAKPPPPVNREVDNATSPLIQGLLEKSLANKEKYRAQRLQDYYRRNFKDYFDFEGGSVQAGKARGLSPETTQKIQQWLKDNP
ncbi:hypothetical protein WJX72_001805 [[Myrmecia] bisecta]|uniref:Uncharacterized protein n=1 Tax=[Myrmecia] bisecta TaxID=41462 RepID=A0AAW1R4Q9_9CHLO